MTTSSHEAPRPWRSRFARLHPTAYLGLHGVVGIALTAALLWAFFAIADEVPEHGAMVRLDVAVARWLEAHGSELGESIFARVSWLGAPVLTGVVVIAVLTFAARRDWLRAGAIALTAGGGVALNDALKMLFHRGRPETASEFITRPSWSFPSGHAMDSLIGFGFLALLLLERTTDRRARTAIVAATVVLVGAIGFSRLYLGVHYLSDVVGGFVAGAIWLMVCITGYQVARRRLDHDAPVDRRPS
jgi:membrane-associated phospholipid phosphatase